MMYYERLMAGMNAWGHVSTSDTSNAPESWLKMHFGLSGADLFLPPAEIVRPTPDVGVSDGRFVTDFADLALNVRSRMELGGDWTRFEPCDAQFGAGCRRLAVEAPEELAARRVEGVEPSVAASE